MCGLKTNNRKFYRILSLTEVSKLPLVLFVRLGLVNFFLVFDFVLWVFWFFFFSLCKLLPLHHPDKGTGFVFPS